MLNNASGIDHIYIACGYTDLRSGIDRLSALVQSSFNLDPYQNSLFLFAAGVLTALRDCFGKGMVFCSCTRDLKLAGFSSPAMRMSSRNLQTNSSDG